MPSEQPARDAPSLVDDEEAEEMTSIMDASQRKQLQKEARLAEERSAHRPEAVTPVAFPVAPNVMEILTAPRTSPPPAAGSAPPPAAAPAAASAPVSATRPTAARPAPAAKQAQDSGGVSHGLQFLAFIMLGVAVFVALRG